MLTCIKQKTKIKGGAVKIKWYLQTLKCAENHQSMHKMTSNETKHCHHLRTFCYKELIFWNLYFEFFFWTWCCFVRKISSWISNYWVLKLNQSCALNWMCEGWLCFFSLHFFQFHPRISCKKPFLLLILVEKSKFLFVCKEFNISCTYTSNISFRIQCCITLTPF